MTTQTETKTGTKVRFTVRRNVAATDKTGAPTKIAMAFCELENGHRFTCAIPEGLIKYSGEGIIANEISTAAAREMSK